MSTTLREVIEYSTYDLTTVKDAQWLLTRQAEFAELIEQAQEVVDNAEEEQTE